MSEKTDWNFLRDLAQRVLNDQEPLVLTENVCALLRRTGEQVALGTEEVEQALSDVPRATGLLREIARRISEGTRRLTPALLRMYRLIEVGDIEGACRQMEEVLAVEVVPLYRNIALGELEKLEELKR
ncbi:DUSAM domain-containing protein [Archangium sp.]|uniref:DUSAM domain-containing protein n=1 Tax=Archangium sp. TaxID=1872627 RepID=UPI00286AC042|nr:DUSAM domain-containing protein [Archangium sp.]